MQSKTLDWFSAKAPTFGNLAEPEKAAIFDFAMLWSFFEARCLGNNANTQQIRNYVQQLDSNELRANEVEGVAAYFKNRYIDNGEFTHSYYHLHLERSGHPQEVTSMLNGAPDWRETLIGCLAVLFRYRNNLFHGEKWEYELQGQQENFEHSTALLRCLMDGPT